MALSPQKLEELKKQLTTAAHSWEDPDSGLTYWGSFNPVDNTGSAEYNGSFGDAWQLNGYTAHDFGRDQWVPGSKAQAYDLEGNATTDWFDMEDVNKEDPVATIAKYMVLAMAGGAAMGGLAPAGAAGGGFGAGTVPSAYGVGTAAGTAGAGAGVGAGVGAGGLNFATGFTDGGTAMGALDTAYAGAGGEFAGGFGGDALGTSTAMDGAGSDFAFNGLNGSDIMSDAFVANGGSGAGGFGGGTGALAAGAGGGSLTNGLNGSDVMSDAFVANGGSGAGGFGGGTGAAGAAAGKGLLDGIGMKEALGLASTVAGAVSGGQGQENEQSTKKDIPEWLKPYVTKNLNYAGGLLDSQMAPGAMPGWGQMRNTGMGLLSAPQAGNGFSRFFPGN